MSDLLQIHPQDDVAVCVHPVTAGTTLGSLRVVNDIPVGHKVALHPIAAGTLVRKYGFPIGRATTAIAAGEHVHSHNLASALEENGDAAATGANATPATAVTGQSSGATFQGYRRPDGRVGIRNEIWIINTVHCINIASEKIAQAAHKRFVAPGGLVDGIYAFTHPYGCSQLGDDLQHTKKILAGLVRHPNAAGVLILGLGCENNQIKSFLEEVGQYDPHRIRFFNAQEVDDEIESGLAAVEELVAYASRFQRETIPASELVLGMKCGGSDGFSGLTANPLVGRVADWLTAEGGTTLLTEVPEMFGAEQVLYARARNEKTLGAMTRMIGDFKNYFHRHNEPVNENPSPGNKAGGITTLEEKSLGCIQKGGQAPIAEVLDYGSPATPRQGGISLIYAPGNDGVSATALTAAGAHLILFTTGRGTPLGLPVPTIKIASNSALAGRKGSWIDFNAGQLLEGRDREEVKQELVQKILAVASGTQLTRNEINGYREITIWKEGVTL